MKQLQPTTQSSRRNQKGQGMVEYIIIVALIAIAAIAAYSYFGKTVRGQVAGMAQDLSGTANTGTGEAQTAAGKTLEEGKDDKGLGNYDDGAIKE
ncbi:MAG: pilus assembly protein Flp/PilA [Gammaproteobacteria bacterium]|jgi:pilus assembly protein Flp/PilA